MPHRFRLTLISLLLAAAAACQGASGSVGTALPPTQAPGVLDLPEVSWEVVGEDLDAVLATPDLAVGVQRFALVLSDDRGLIRLPVVQFTAYRYPEGFSGAAGRSGPEETAIATFYEFPLGTRGIYVAELEFDSVGDWSVEASVPRPDGSTSSVEVRFPVKERTRSVAVGERPPASRNRTLADVPDLADLTTGSHRDPQLYGITVAEALENGRPFVVVFASPAFCTNAVCGPQVEVASELREVYGDRVTFIHVDLYENPREIQGDLGLAVNTPLLDEWGLVSQEWTFVVGGDGRVSARFENFVAAAELEEAIQRVLQDV